MRSIVETLEVLQLLKIMAECYVEAKKDGKLNWMDVPKFQPVMAAMGKAIDGADRIESELKDIDLPELFNIADKLREIAFVLKGTK